MPRGTRHQLTGLLLLSERGPVLAMDDGGYWALDLPPGKRRLAGQRVTIEGLRSGFNLIDVDRIAKA